MAFAFEKLHVYQKAAGLAAAIHSALRGAPRGSYFLVDQLSRAAVSIAANLAEGNGRFTVVDRRSFFSIARGSVQECVLLELAARRGLITPGDHERFKADVEEIARMLSGLIRGLSERSP